MSSLSTYIVIGLGVLVFAAFVYALLVSSLRMLRDDGRLRLRAMLGRYGAALDVAPGEHAAYQGALATRRCVACAEKARCDAWLDSGARDGAEAFCPNTGFVRNAARETQPAL